MSTLLTQLPLNTGAKIRVFPIFLDSEDSG